MTNKINNPYEPNNVYEVTVFKNRKEWLANRHTGIGASDCGIITGSNPYQTMIELYRDKVYPDEVVPIKQNAAMEYGIKAETHLRKLFELSEPRYKMFYKKNVSLRGKEHPFMLYSPDGLLYDTEGSQYGIYEGKTTTINSRRAAMEWDNRIPEHYFTQLLHSLIVTNFDFAILNVEIRRVFDGNQEFIRKHYRFEKSDYEKDIEYLVGKEIEFWDYVQRKEQPPLMIKI